MEHNISAEQRSQKRTHLFTMRLWRESTEEDRLEIRGKVQHVLTGEVKYFRDWATLEEFLTTQVASRGGDP